MAESARHRDGIDCLDHTRTSPATALTKADANPQQLTELLPKARYAHFATHGYFDAETLTAEQQRATRREKRANSATTRGGWPRKTRWVSSAWSYPKAKS